MRARPSSRWLSSSLAALLLCVGASPAAAYISETSPRALHPSDAQNRTGDLNSFLGIPVEVRCLVRADAHRAISICTYEIASDPIETRYVHADGLGSIRKLTDESGAVTDSYTYSAFGELLEHAGSDAQPYMFAGEAWEGGAGLYYNRARWLDVGTGRFVSEDPFEGVREDPPSLHKYLYAGLSPVSRVDPSGKYFGGIASVAASVAIGAAIAAVAIGVVNWAYSLAKETRRSDPELVVSAIDDSDYVGRAASFVRFSEIYMSSVKTMVDNVLKAVGGSTIGRLNIIDHGNPDGFEVGSDYVDGTTFPAFRTEFERLRGRFAGKGFVHLQHCEIGRNHVLLAEVASAVGAPVYAGTGFHNPVFRINYGDYERCEPSGTCDSNVSLP